jgi:hypothetical protein
MQGDVLDCLIIEKYQLIDVASMLQCRVMYVTDSYPEPAPPLKKKNKKKKKRE